MSNVKEYIEGIELSGYISDMPESIYHNTEGFISKSSLTVLKESPFKYANRQAMKQTPAMAIGSAIHCAVLEPAKFEKEYCLLPDCKDRRQKEFKDAVKEFGADKVFPGSDAENIVAMFNAVMGNDAAAELLSLPGWCEVSGFHVDEETGVKIRHRFDKLTRCGVAIDLKKTQSVHPDELAKTIYKYGYHIQDALYSDAYAAINGHDLQQFYFIFVEEKFPHEVAVVYLDDVSKQVGRDEYRQLLADHVYYTENPEKAKNNSGIEMISLPEWALRSYELELEEEGIF